MVKHAPLATRLAGALAAFAPLAPWLLLVAVAMHLAELLFAVPAGTATGALARTAIAAVLADAVAVARYLPLACLASLPWLMARSVRVRAIGTAATLAVPALVHGALTQYLLRAGVPLGADLLAYSGADIRQAIGDVHVDAGWIATTLLLALLAAALFAWRLRRAAPAKPRAWGAGLLAACVAAWATTVAGFDATRGTDAESLRQLRANRLAFFADELLRPRATAPAVVVAQDDATGASHAAAAPGATPGAAADARWPFLHDTRVPDTLGPLLDLDARDPPNIVVIIVEGLGRSFSGPDAPLGSFTPFLDELATRSLYWRGFFAPQGRTFGVLPSLLGSAPFGEHGLLEQPAPLPAHANLPALLHAHGYATRFFSGTHAHFDNQLAYLQLAGFDRIIDRGHLDAEVPVASEWGYDDATVLRHAASVQSRAAGQPFLDVVQTISMHDPFAVPGEATWRERFEQRLAQLGLTGARAEAARAHADVYAAILFTDAALRDYFEAARHAPGFGNTVFIVTGDHRLVEIPMDARIERYQVPLLVYSPRLRAPAQFPGVSSHFDVTPSIATLLAHRYGWQLPARTTWLGGALDTGTARSDGRSLPMMQTKAELSDFISGEWYLGHGQLYRLGAGLATEPVRDATRQAQVQARFDAFLAANARFAHDRRLMPDGASAAAAAIASGAAASASASAPPSRALSVPVAAASRDAAGGHIAVRFELANGGAGTSVSVAPLAVLLDAAGHELQEAYGQAVQLQPHERLPLHLQFASDALPAGPLFVTVFASDPTSGARIGNGAFHLPVATAP